MGQNQRRYPRVPLDHPGEMEVRVHALPGAAARSVMVPVTIRTVSCEGMGLALRGSNPIGIGVGTAVTMRLQVGAAKVEIPGRIVWFDPREVQSQPDLGVHLQLEIARAVMRQQWAEWVVELTRLRTEPA